MDPAFTTLFVYNVNRYLLPVLGVKGISQPEKESSVLETVIRELKSREEKDHKARFVHGGCLQLGNNQTPDRF